MSSILPPLLPPFRSTLYGSSIREFDRPQREVPEVRLGAQLPERFSLDSRKFRRACDPAVLAIRARKSVRLRPLYDRALHTPPFAGARPVVTHSAAIHGLGLSAATSSSSSTSRSLLVLENNALMWISTARSKPTGDSSRVPCETRECWRCE